MLKLEYHHFSIHNDVKDLGNDHQWLIISQTGYVPSDGTVHHHLENKLAKNTKGNLISLLDYEIKGSTGKENHAKDTTGIQSATPRR